MAMNKKQKKIIDLTVKYFFSAVLIVFFFFPFLFMINKSMFTIDELGGVDVHFFPNHFNLANYKVFADYLSYLGNTMQVVLINCVFIPLTACLSAYPLARRGFHGKKVVFLIIMATVMMPGVVLQIPTYIMFSGMGLVDNLASLWVQAFFGGGALNIFLVIQFMRTIPKDFDEAAKIDGANAFQIFFLIIFPQLFNVMLYIAITVGIGLWMDFQGPLIYLVSEENRTLALQFYISYTNATTVISKQNELAAMAVCMTIPPIVLFLVFQKKMIGGIKIGGVKG